MVLQQLLGQLQPQLLAVLHPVVAHRPLVQDDGAAGVEREGGLLLGEPQLWPRVLPGGSLQLRHCHGNCLVKPTLKISNMQLLFPTPQPLAKLNLTTSTLY